MATATDDLNAIEIRRTGLGASDAAAACGIDPYKTTLRLYLEKTGELPPDEETDALRIGKIFEPGILEFFSWKTGKPIIDTQVLRKVKSPASCAGSVIQV